MAYQKTYEGNPFYDEQGNFLGFGRHTDKFGVGTRKSPGPSGARLAGLRQNQRLIEQYGSVHGPSAPTPNQRNNTMATQAQADEWWRQNRRRRPRQQPPNPQDVLNRRLGGNRPGFGEWGPGNQWGQNYPARDTPGIVRNPTLPENINQAPGDKMGPLPSGQYTPSPDIPQGKIDEYRRRGLPLPGQQTRSFLPPGSPTAPDTQPSPTTAPTAPGTQPSPYDWITGPYTPNWGYDGGNGGNWDEWIQRNWPDGDWNINIDEPWWPDSDDYQPAPEPNPNDDDQQPWDQNGSSSVPPPEVPPYVGPEDIQGINPPAWQSPGQGGYGLTQAQASSWGSQTPEPSFYGFSGGDYQELEDLIYEDIMQPARRELAYRGLGESTAMAHAATDAGSKAARQRYKLQAQEQARRTNWEQNQAMQQWQQANMGYQNQLRRWQAQRQAQERSAQNRRKWLWDTYMLPRSEYWQQIDTMLQSIITPYQAGPQYQSQRPQYVNF